MAVNEGIQRFSGMYGAAYRGDTLLSDVIEVSGTVEVARTDVPVVGTTRNAYKPGREAREGTIRFHKMDSSWELELYQYFSQTLADRRAARGTPAATLRPFEILIAIDDPEAGIESVKLQNVLIWRMTLGFSITDELLERELPMTWESEVFIEASRRQIGPNGQYASPPVYVPAYQAGVKKD